MVQVADFKPLEWQITIYSDDEKPVSDAAPARFEKIVQQCGGRQFHEVPLRESLEFEPVGPARRFVFRGPPSLRTQLERAWLNDSSAELRLSMSFGEYSPSDRTLDL